MELSLAQELEGIVEKLVTSGQRQLDKPMLKKLKSLCKQNNDNVKHCFHLLVTQFHKDHAEIRYSAFQIVDELFVRSHVFRQLLLDMFNEFMDLTMETDFENPLPPPRHIADKLKSEALAAVKKWHDKYGIAYSKLALAMHFLQNVKKIKFDNPTPQDNSERQAEHARNTQRQIVNGMKLDKLTKSINKNLWEIKSCTTEIQNCLLLLVPDFKNSESESTEINGESTEAMSEISRDTGLPKSGYSIEIDMAAVSSMHVRHTHDNKAILERTKDLLKSAHKIYLPRIRSWISVASKCGAPPSLIKQLIDDKFALQQVLQKYKELNLDGVDVVIPDSDESDCDDFVEVPEVGQTDATSTGGARQVKKNKKVAYVPGSTEVNTNIWKPMRAAGAANDPTSYQHALEVQAKRRKLEQKANDTKISGKPLKKIIPKFGSKQGSQDKTLFDKAPVIPFGQDLLAWDKERENELRQSLSMGSAKEYDIGHRFWSGTSASEGDSGVSDAAMTALTTRTIEFTGTYKPVTRSCRAPLPSGRLCPRQDRYKCPFHGKIIDRDASGKPIVSKDGQPSTSKVEASSAWDDALFLQELEHSSGGKIKFGKNKKVKQRKPDNGLTDLKKIHDTSRSRLQKKIFNAGSVKRVAGMLDNLDNKRNHDKFGNNFSYALN